MLKAKIFIAVDSRILKESPKYYGYVLECVTAKGTQTREGFGELTGTYNQATLAALSEALGRFSQPCEVTVCSANRVVLCMLDSLGGYAGNAFLDSRGKPLANQGEWMDIWELAGGHTIHTEPGKHEYTDWLLREIERRKQDV